MNTENQRAHAQKERGVRFPLVCRDLVKDAVRVRDAASGCKGVPGRDPGGMTAGKDRHESPRGNQRECMRPEACESATGGSTCASALATLPHYGSPVGGPMGTGQPAAAGPASGHHSNLPCAIQCSSLATSSATLRRSQAWSLVVRVMVKKFWPRGSHNRAQQICCAAMTQLSIPTDVTAAEIMRKRSLGDAIALGLEVAGLEPKQIKIDGKHIDKAQWSRWASGDEGIKWPKLRAVMDQCGNDAPLLWMAYDRGYELSSMHKRESEIERQLREAREENAALRRVLAGRV